MLWNSFYFEVNWFHFKTSSEVYIRTFWLTKKPHFDRILTALLIFLKFPKQTKSLELLNMFFENSLPKANFGQNIRDSPNGSLTADSRSLQTATLKKLLWKTFHMFLSAWISDNGHICNSYLLIFHSLYRISAKNTSIADYVNTELILNHKPITSKQPFQLRFVP